jgi:integrase
MLADGLSPARRNRALIMASRFFKWAMRTRRAFENPFAGIKLLKEERGSDIVFCSKAERDIIIAMAEDTGDVDALAVMIAFYAGLRRGEIYRLAWEDIDFERRFLKIRKSKTKVGRNVPIGARLMDALSKAPESKRKGLVIPLHKDVNAIEHSNSFLTKLRRYAKATGAAVSEEQISWNVFRHTFASLYIQEGGTLDKGCAILGNTREVFLRHYGNLHPKDRFDEFVDRL